MKASFPPFASCFPPWSCFARPRRLKSACHVARLVAAKPLRSDFRLLENALTNCCQHLRGGRLQLSPRGTLIADQRRTCAARPKGKYSRGRMALAPIRTREFFLPRGAAGGQGHSQLKTSNFTSHTGSLLLSSLKKVTFLRFLRSLVPLISRPLFAKSSAGEQAPPTLQIMFSFL